MAIAWKKLAFDADLLAHIALTTAHGAVSAATASKMVVRNGSARAKFAAPGAAGDALIKGTRVTVAELPAMTDEKIWVGTGANVEERDMPGGGGGVTFDTTQVYNANLPTSWTDLNLSAVVGSNQAVCLLKVYHHPGVGSINIIKFRKNGETTTMPATGSHLNTLDLPVPGYKFGYVLIITDSSGIVEWIAVVAKTVTITFEAYWV